MQSDMSAPYYPGFFFKIDLREPPGLYRSIGLGRRGRDNPAAVRRLGFPTSAFITGQPQFKDILTKKTPKPQPKPAPASPPVLSAVKSVCTRAPLQSYQPRHSVSAPAASAILSAHAVSGYNQTGFPPSEYIQYIRYIEKYTWYTNSWSPAIRSPALREILLNALVHRDYLGSMTQIKVFDNRICVWNAGRLPEELTIQKLFEPH